MVLLLYKNTYYIDTALFRQPYIAFNSGFITMHHLHIHLRLQERCKEGWSYGFQEHSKHLYKKESRQLQALFPSNFISRNSGAERNCELWHFLQIISSAYSWALPLGHLIIPIPLPYPTSPAIKGRKSKVTQLILTIGLMAYFQCFHLLTQNLLLVLKLLILFQIDFFSIYV